MDFLNNKITRHVLSVLAIILVSAIYFYPELSGKKILSHDEVSSVAAAKQMKDFDKKGETILWGNTIFSGMPLFQVAYVVKSNLLLKIVQMLEFMPKSMWLWIMLVLGFYISLSILGYDSGLSLIGSFAFGLSTWFMLSIEAGHATKILAIAFVPPMLASIIVAYRGQWLVGSVLTSLFLSMAIMANHPQIVYYSLFFILAIFFVYLYEAIKNKQLPVFVKRSLILFMFGVLGVLPNTTLLWTTYDYSTETIRGGKSELTKTVSQSTGLDIEYAMQWSYGKAETMNLLVPGLYAGGAVLDENSETYKDLVEKGVPKAQIKDYLKGIPMYYGEQPFTTGPSYLGAALLFLFLMLFFITKSNLKWILFTVTIVSIVFSWGSNFLVINEFFFNHFPLFNKFRVPSMWLSLTMMTVAIGAVASLSIIFNKQLDKIQFKKGLIYTSSILGGLTLLLMLFGPSMLSFDGAYDTQLEKSGFNIDLLIEDRLSILFSDALRTLAIIAITAVILWMVNNDKIKNLTLAKIILAAVVIGDIWMVDKRFVNDNDFVKAKSVEQSIKPTNADQQILNDKELNYRVFNASVNSFNDNNTSYYHHSVGGYSAAKLIRYQDLIENHLSKGNMSVFNMLNTKYFITGKPGEEIAQQNPNALGNVWFVDSIDWATNADEEMKKLASFNPKTTAVVDERFKNYVGNYVADSSATGTIKLTNFHPDNMVYQSTSDKEKLAVFSEIWYKGNVDWKAYLDGKEVEFIRVNYLLRGMKIPAGTHEIVFKFHPDSHYIGNKISFASSVLILILLSGLLLMVAMKKDLPGLKED